MSVRSRSLSRIRMGTAIALLLSWPRQGSAQVAVGADASAAKETSGGWGLGIDGRVGYRFGLPRGAILHSVVFQVEAIGGQMFLAPWADPVKVDWLGTGARLGWLLNAFEPFAFGHISVAAGTGGWGYLGDAGGALDWRLPTFSLGLHAKYNWLAVADGTRQIFEFGPHVEVRSFWQ